MNRSLTKGYTKKSKVRLKNIIIRLKFYNKKLWLYVFIIWYLNLQIKNKEFYQTFILNTVSLKLFLKKSYEFNFLPFA